MNEPAFATEDHVQVKILESCKSERDESDKRYAPILVKTIVYSIVGIMASGVAFGIANVISSNFVHKAITSDIAPSNDAPPYGP